MGSNFKSASEINKHVNNNTNLVQARNNTIDLLHSEENGLESKIAVFRISSDYSIDTKFTKQDIKLDRNTISSRNAKRVTESVDDGSHLQRVGNGYGSARKTPSNKAFQQNYKSHLLNKITKDYSHDFRNNDDNHSKNKSNEHQKDSGPSESFVNADHSRYIRAKSERKYTDILKRISKPSNITQNKKNTFEEQKRPLGMMKWTNEDEFSTHDINSKIQSKSSRAQRHGIPRVSSFPERLAIADTNKFSIGNPNNENLQKKTKSVNLNGVFSKSQPSNITQNKKKSFDEQKRPLGMMKWTNDNEFNPHEKNSKIQSKSSRAKRDGIPRDSSFQERLAIADTGKFYIGKPNNEKLQKKKNSTNLSGVYNTKTNKRPFVEPKYHTSSHINVNAPKSASKMVVKRCYHVRISEPIESEAWFNSVFSFGDNYNIGLMYEGKSIQITPYYWSNKYE